MEKLNLVIADTNTGYVESTVNYFMTNYFRRFQISSFTEWDFLYDFLSGPRNVDILLISPQMYKEALPKDNIGEVIILTSGQLPKELDGLRSIDRNLVDCDFVTDILERYSRESPDIDTGIHAVKKSKTKVIAVYSPLGGVGKTTISVSTSIRCGENGLKAFYLNLEPFQSTSLFFNCKSGENFSKILQNIKENGGNFHLKVNEMKCTDPEYNVDYFPPSQDILNIADFDPQNFKDLINEFRDMNEYDIIVVDMSNTVDERNLAVLEQCDKIVVVLAQDAISNIKAGELSRQLDTLKEESKLDFAGKLVLVLNRYNFHMALEVETVAINGEYISVYIPEVPGMASIKGTAQLVDLRGEFGDGIQELVDSLI